MANSIIAPSVPRQRTSDTERFAKSDAKFDPTNGLHKSLVNIFDSFDQVALA